VTLDADHHLTVRFSHRMPAENWTPDKFKITTSHGDELRVTAVYPFRHRGEQCAVYSVETAERFDYPQVAYTCEIAGFGKHHVLVGYILRDGTRYFDADAKMGVTYTPDATTFRVFAPGAVRARVIIAERAEGAQGVFEHEMSTSGKSIWETTLEGNLAGKFYAFKLNGADLNPSIEIPDIYATCTQTLASRTLIVDLAKTDPPGFREHAYTLPKSPAHAIVYEMHVRDFTIAANSGIERKGKYLGLTESRTTLPGDPAIKTGLDHLVELGVTHVQLMPVHDFFNEETDSDQYNWGYMPMNFFSPDGWYAGSSKGDGKIRELKQAIQALHERGLGVILDVVYNHTAGEAPFELLVPGYYFRLTLAGNFSNGSGCGNEMDSELPMVRKLMLDSVRFWLEEYRVDGFRFDLMGLIDIETMKQIHAEVKRIRPEALVYGEPWAAAPTPLRPVTEKALTRGTGIGAFNDGFRNAIKGSVDGTDCGYIQCGHHVEGVVKGLMGGIHDWSHDPTDSINYFEAHDNLTAWDKLLKSVPHAGDEDRRRMARLAALILFTSQGTIFMHAGQEMCRTKKGEHNSYNLPDDINQIDWEWKKTHADVYHYYRGLIALRKSQPALRLATRADVERRVAFFPPPDPRCIVYRIDAHGLEGSPVERVLVLLNGAPDPVKVELPEQAWRVLVNEEKAGPEELARVSESVIVPPHAGLVLVS
jgi:pullulanase